MNAIQYLKIKSHKQNENNFWNNFEKGIFFNFSHFFCLSSRKFGQSATSHVLAIPLPILGGWWLYRLPFRRHFIHIAAIQLIAARIRVNMLLLVLFMFSTNMYKFIFKKIFVSK
jgi:hypothetical protein